ncbi:MAG: hypothetical protein ABIJ46_05310 [bacterium]
MKFRSLFFALVLAAGALFGQVGSAAAAELPILHLFWAEGCPHCAHAKEYLADELLVKYPELEVRFYEVSGDRGNMDLFRWTGEQLGTTFNGVPVIVIGEEYLQGFRDAETTGPTIESKLLLAAERGDSDVVLGLPGTVEESGAVPVIEDPSVVPEPAIVTPTPEEDVTEEVVVEPVVSESESEPAPETAEDVARIEGLPGSVSLPLIGEISLIGMPLPLLTVTLGFLDGFNPCAMWVLLFLLSLLVGMPNRRRAWLLGLAFILTTALVYFLFLAAWLQVFLFLGVVGWIRLLVGVVALAAGGYYLYDFLCSNGSCKVVNGRLREKVFALAKGATGRRSLLLALVGVIVLAVAVNLIELVCSIGLPAVYTQVLVLSDLSTWQHYGYLLLYTLVFLADDLFVFFSAMLLLQLVGISHKYTHWTRLIGGVLMLIIGLLLLFSPGTLSFA